MSLLFAALTFIIVFASQADAGIIRQNVRSFSKSGSTPLIGAVTISEGTNITLTQSGQDISISSTGGGSSSSTSVVEHRLDGGITFWDGIDAPTAVESNTSLSQVRLTAQNSGALNSTESIHVIIEQNSPGSSTWKTSTATLTPNGGPNTVLYNLNPTFTAVSGDRFRASITGVPNRGAPEDLSVKFLFY